MQRIEMWASRMPLVWGAITGWVAVLFIVMGWLDSPFKWIVALLIWSEALVLSWRAGQSGFVFGSGSSGLSSDVFAPRDSLRRDSRLEYRRHRGHQRLRILVVY